MAQVVVFNHHLWRRKYSFDVNFMIWGKKNKDVKLNMQTDVDPLIVHFFDPCLNLVIVQASIYFWK